MFFGWIVVFVVSRDVKDVSECTGAGEEEWGEGGYKR